MSLHELTETGIVEIPKSTFRSEQIAERQDLQRLLRDQITVVAEGCMVLAEEFGEWEESRRRIDLLCLDSDANLVVVELKRSEDGGHMELQALRYAAMVSTMTFEQAVRAHRQFLASRGSVADAEQSILEFLEWAEPDDEQFGQDVRVVLVSADFGIELTTSVLWLNEQNLDIRCVQLRPYALEGRVLLDVRQVVPLPEASDYIVRVREKERREREVRQAYRDFTKYDVTVGGVMHRRLNKRHVMLAVLRHLCEMGHEPEAMGKALARGKLWYCVDGELSGDDFVEQATSAQTAGSRFELRRWFCEDDELVRMNGRTYALTKMWGGDVDKLLAPLLLQTGARDVKVEARRE